MRFLIPLGAFLFVSFNLRAEMSSQGEIRLEMRAFQNDDIDVTNDYGYGFFTRLESEKEFKNDIKIKARGFGRVYQIDESRNYFYLEDLFMEKDWGNTQFFMGLRTFNWSFAEAFHPNDIINARNFDSNFENAEKIGQPTIGLQYQKENHGFGIYLFPTLVKPNLPFGSRLSFTPDSITNASRRFIDTDGEVIENQTYLSGILFYDLSAFGGDLKLFWYHGHDREQPQALLLPGPSLSLNFLAVDQIGLNIVKEVGTFMIKSEIAHKAYAENSNFQRSDHTIVSIGIEKTFFWNKSQETMLILEGQGLFGAENDDDARALNFFQRDVLLGLRHSFNDAYSQEVFFSIIADVDKSKEILASISYTRRLSDQWKLSGSLRYIDAPQSGLFPVGFESLDEDHQVSLQLSRFF